MNNSLCREPNAGKSHVRIYVGVRLVRGVSTHQVLAHFCYGKFELFHLAQQVNLSVLLLTNPLATIYIFIINYICIFDYLFISS